MSETFEKVYYNPVPVLLKKQKKPGIAKWMLSG
jgi:hypothetical protein